MHNVATELVPEYHVTPYLIIDHAMPFVHNVSSLGLSIRNSASDYSQKV
jgi:hypothetical protein